MRIATTQKRDYEKFGIPGIIATMVFLALIGVYQNLPEGSDMRPYADKIVALQTTTSNDMVIMMDGSLRRATTDNTGLRQIRLSECGSSANIMTGNPQQLDAVSRIVRVGDATYRAVRSEYIALCMMQRF